MGAKWIAAWAGLAFGVLAACSSAPQPTNEELAEGAQTRSLAGKVLFAPPLAPDELAKRQDQLAQARADWEAKPHDADTTIWLGRRLAYIGRFRDAVDVFSRGIEEHPDDARFYRHRGHRYITLRDFERAIPDLERAASLVANKPDEVEPDGLPNKAGVPLETLKSNIYYHLALAHYLLGHFEASRDTWLECRRWSANPDNLCSATHWLYMTLRRMGREAEAREALAPIRGDLQVLEYRSYHQLCLAYAGELDIDRVYAEAKAGGVDTTDFATVGYGAGNWHLYNGDKERALAIFREVEAGAQWHAFGNVASEVELARLK
jgi:tetratricopeptide (TPR) repeat protein